MNHERRERGRNKQASWQAEWGQHPSMLGPHELLTHLAPIKEAGKIATPQERAVVVEAMTRGLLGVKQAAEFIGE